MVVTCDHCGSRYKLADHKITGRGAKITCPNCRHVFVVYRDADGASGSSGRPSGSSAVASVPGRAASPSSGPTLAAVAIPAGGNVRERVEVPLVPPMRSEHSGGGSAGSGSGSTGGFSVTFVEGNAAVEAEEELSADELDYASVGISAWKVKVRIGLVYDFNDLGTLRKYIADGRVTNQDHLSHDGKTWVPIGEIPDLEAHFIEVYKAARDSASAPAVKAPAAVAPEHELTDMPSPDDFSEEQPTNIVGMAALSSSVASGMLGDAPEPAGLQKRPRSPSPASLPSTGDADAQGPRFIDPFEQMRAEKRRAAKGRKRSSGGGRTPVPDAGGGDPPASSRVPRNLPPDIRPSNKGGGRTGAILGALALLALLGIGGAVVASGVLSGPPQVDQPPPPDPLMEAAEARSTQEGGEGSGTNDFLEGIKNLPVEAPDAPSWEDDGEPELIPVVPKDVRTAASRGSTPSGTGSADGGIVARPTTASDHAAAGDAMRGQGDWTGAIRAYREAVKADPGNPVWLEKLGVAQYESGDKSGAKATLSQAKDSGALRADKYLGHIARDQGDVAGAIARYVSYLQSNPSDAAEINRQIAELQQG